MNTVQVYVRECWDLTLTKPEMLLCMANLFNLRNFEGLEISMNRPRLIFIMNM